MDNLIFYGYEFLASFIPFFIVLLLFRCSHKGKSTHVHRSYYMAILFFALYIIAVFHFTGAGTLYNGLMYQLEIRKDQLNFIPFSNEIDITAYLLNVILFIPLGLFVPFIWVKMNKFICITGTGFVLSLLIETSQLLNNRRSDIDDIILNTLGAVIGFVLFQLWNKFSKRKFHLGFLHTTELPIYIFVLFVGRFLLFNEMGLAKLLYGF